MTVVFLTWIHVLRNIILNNIDPNYQYFHRFIKKNVNCSIIEGIPQIENVEIPVFYKYFLNKKEEINLLFFY